MNFPNSAALGLRPEDVGNPFAAIAESDYFGEPRRDVPTWSETGFFEAWNPDQGVGIFTHVGRCQQDLDLWWGQTFVYLPDGRIAVDRSWGRAPAPGQVGAGNLRIEVAEPLKRWRVGFDGAGELTSTECLTRGLGGAGIATPIRFEVEGTAAGPFWDMYGCVLTHAGDWAGDSHSQQTYRTTGWLTVGSERYRLDGVGFNDHSRGPRSFTSFGSHRWLVAVMPGWTVHAINIFDRQGDRQMAVGTIFRGDRHEMVTMEMPGFDDLIGAPSRFDIGLTTAAGETLTLSAAVKHCFVLTITDDNHNLNGAGWDAAADPVFHMENVVELTTPDGEIGYGHAERSSRVSQLPGGARRG